MPTKKKDGHDADVLFDFASRRSSRGPGPVEQAAVRTLDGAVSRGELDDERDALLIAHAVSLAARVDDCAERFDPYGAAQVSRELRETYRDLGLPTGDARRPQADPFTGLFDEPVPGMTAVPAADA